MTERRRLLAVGAILALAAVVSFSHVWGEPARNKELDKWRAEGDKPTAAERQLGEDLAASKFAQNPVVTYRTQEGETFFALQVKPDLARAAARPRDFLVLIDTSASQARGPLGAAIKITEALAASLGVEDRIAIRTATNKCKELTAGFQPGSKTQGALQALKLEYPAGATDLKTALKESVNSFESKPGRQQILLYLGDGGSLLAPITPEDRTQLSDSMVKAEIAFFPLPLGPRLTPENLHGFATSTGGAPVRMLPGDRVEDTLQRLYETVSAPILYPTSFKVLGDVAESLPTQPPPLRSDSPTLVVGRMKAGATVGYSVTGTVAGKQEKREKVETLPETEVENFFLVGMVRQWRNAKDAPALIRADRALAYAMEVNHLAREELKTQAEMAMGKDKWDVAEKMFQEVQKLDPNDQEAKAGQDIARRLREGTLTKEQLHEQAKTKPDDFVVRITKLQKDRVGNDPLGRDNVKVTRERLLALAQEAGGDRKPDAAPIAPPEAPADILREAKQRQAVEDQRMTQVVDDALRRSRQVLRVDPDEAHRLLKQALDGVRNNPDLSERTRETLAQRIDLNLRDVDTQGVRIKRDLEEQLQRIAEARNRLANSAAEAAASERIIERMRVFHNLMNEAREQYAQEQANNIRQDLVNQGLPVPPAVTAAYIVAENGYNYREFEELKRIKQDKWLQTMLLVDKSSVPFPDEPPIAYPPALKWREISKRRDKYETSYLGEDVPARTFELKKNLQKPVDFKGMDDKNTTLQEALDFLADRYDLTFDVNDQAFKAEMIDDVMSKGIAADKPIPKMKNVSLETVLRRILSRVPYPGTTYIIRRDAIEITTLKAVALEKTVRAYPVADLVVPIPNSINAQSVQQSGSIFGYFGAAGVQGGFNGLQGVQGGGFQGFGGFQGIGGGFGGFQGQLGGAQFGLQGGLQVAGGFGGMGQQNLGVGGGALGFGGGQLGQFGNLGGQFGLQGGTQEKVLMDLIRQVVGYPRDWVPRNAGGLAVGNVGAAPGGQPDDTSGDQETGNALGYFPAALALVVKGTSRTHTRAGGPGYNPLPPVQGAMERDGVIRIDGGRNKKNTKIGGAEENVNQNKMKTKPPPLADADPKAIWQRALARGIEDPGIIIATADYLVDAGRFDHAAEFLKANLRQGILVKPWVYEALAVALKESKASPEEVERAETSEADLEPQDSQGFLRAAQAMAEHKNYERALGFCRQAAALEPDVPYAYDCALAYAAQVKDTEAMEWAAGNLTRRDWPANNQDLQNKAKDRAASLAKSLDSDNNKPAADRLRSALAKQRQRDLVIRLTWQGEADLDLKVLEPNGNVCSWLNRQTVGGGVLIGDTLNEVGGETYIAAQAFPGTYKVTVDQVWGRPLGGKAKLEVIRHQGTAQETTETVTVTFSNTNTLTVRLDDGRRTEAAAVAPPSAIQKPEPAIETNDRDRVWAQLRALSEPSENGTGLRGDLSATGAQTTRETVRAMDGARGEQLAYQTRVQPFVSGSVNLTAQATISADRRYVRLSVAPMFTTVTGTQQQPNVLLPLIPGVP
jgi:hypothetical protein